MTTVPGRVRITRAGLIGTLVVLLVAAGCVRLGFWQLERLGERRARNALMRDRMTEAAVPLSRLADREDAAYRRVLLTGGCQNEPLVLAARSRRGAPGAHLLCRFRTDGGDVVLLDRGWVHSADARTVPAELLRVAPRDTTIEALLVPFPAGEAVARQGRTAARIARDSTGTRLIASGPPVMYRLNRAEARAVTGLDLPPWYAQVVAAGGPVEGPPYPADPPDLSPGPHLGYAVQWFSFALIALVGWSILAAGRGEVAVERR